MEPSAVTETREIPAQMMRAALQSVDAEKRTVEVVWTTGSRVLRGFFDRFWEELSLKPSHVRMDRLKSGAAPFLMDHNGYRVADTPAVVTKASLSNGEGRATIRFDAEGNDPEADKLFRKIQNGIVKNVSMGYRIHKLEIAEKAEAREDKIPVYRAVDWEPFEISAVSIPADPGAGFRSEAGEKLPHNLCTFVTRDETSHPQQEETRKMEKTPEQIAAEKAADEKRAAELAEARAAGEEAGRVHMRELQRLGVALGKEGDAFVKRSTESKISLDQARKEAFEILAKRSDETEINGQTRATVTEDKRDKSVKGATAWMIQRLGFADQVRVAQDAKQIPKIDLDPGEFRGFKPVDLARICLENAGESTRGLSGDRMVAKAMTLHREGGFHATSDFGVLLETAMFKILQSAYAITADTWSDICAVSSVPDFRPSFRYRVGSLSRLEKVTENSEFKNKIIPDGEKAQISAETYGNIIALTRQAIVNDDLGYFASLMNRLGRAAKLSVELAFYELLALNSGLGPTQTDGQPFFHTTHKNVAGSGTVLSVDGIDKNRVLLGSQTDITGNEILDLKPAIMLLPLGLGAQARLINTSITDPNIAGKIQVPNVAVNTFRKIVDTARLTGTRRYIFADPASVPAFEVAFLDGEREPVLESREGWRVDGTEMKVRYDFGIKDVDYRGAVTDAGV